MFNSKLTQNYVFSQFSINKKKLTTTLKFIIDNMNNWYRHNDTTSFATPEFN